MSLFVPVKDPADVRRELLTGSKDIISALRRYEHYRELRKAKMQASHDLSKTWTDLAKLMRKLKTALPKTDIKIPQIPKVHLVHTTKKKAVAKKTTTREHHSKIQLLEKQLTKIEGRLSSLP